MKPGNPNDHENTRPSNQSTDSEPDPEIKSHRDHVVTSFDALTREMDHLPMPTAPATPPRADGSKAVALPSLDTICAAYQRVKPTLDLGTKILRMLPFSWAFRIADALTQLSGTLEMVCVKMPT